MIEVIIYFTSFQKNYLKESLNELTSNFINSFKDVEYLVLEEDNIIKIFINKYVKYNDIQDALSKFEFSDVEINYLNKKQDNKANNNNHNNNQGNKMNNQQNNKQSKKKDNKNQFMNENEKNSLKNTINSLPKPEALNVEENSLIILAGPPGVGKTTWIKSLNKNIISSSEIAKGAEYNKNDVIVVASDEIRGEIFGDENHQGNPAKVFETFHNRIKEYLDAGHTVIADSTALESRARKTLRQISSRRNKNNYLVMLAWDYDNVYKSHQERGYRPLPDFAHDRMMRRLHSSFSNINNEEYTSKLIVSREQLPEFKVIIK